ncbi:Ger(x)C family spore germination protein [Niallia taxi]|uniref:Ger(x)C family spore germination protein n=1 Tax=Niallia taxi TaxID=2499688 RepID=UPI002E1E8A60|nr:Ger(x)C family spore germination protein [Niallia taxi]MED4036261.1 Ger(x)C family spore germination protein [Niallia taxi]
MRNLISFIFIICYVFLLTGCFGAKEIESETYITAIGLDYEAGEFKVYIQGLSFGNIAKQEGASIEQQPILIGEAKGANIVEAYGKLEQMAELPLNNGHVHTIILSKNIMEKNMEDVLDLISHSPLLRYTFYLFGTEENLQSLMQTQSFFNFSQLYSVIHKPERIIKYNFELPILIYNEFVSRYYRPVGTILVPSLTIDNTHFTEDKEKPVPVMNGEYLFSSQQYKGWISKEDLSGLRWFNKGIQAKTVRIGTENVSVRVSNPRAKIEVIEGKTPSYKIVVKGDAVLTQNRKNQSLREIETELNKEITKDIVTTIKKGKLFDTDVLNISEKSYKYYSNKWNVNTIRKFNEDSVKEIQVKIRVDSGNSK